MLVDPVFITKVVSTIGFDHVIWFNWKDVKIQTIYYN